MNVLHTLRRATWVTTRRFFSTEQAATKTTSQANLSTWQKLKAGVRRDAMGIINVVALFMLVSLATQYRKLSHDRKEINEKITTFKRRWDSFEMSITSDEYVEVSFIEYICI